MTSSLNGEASLRGERPFVSRQTSLTSLFLADRAPPARNSFAPCEYQIVRFSHSLPLRLRNGGGRVFPGKTLRNRNLSTVESDALQRGLCTDCAVSFGKRILYFSRNFIIDGKSIRDNNKLGFRTKEYSKIRCNVRMWNFGKSRGRI